MQQPESLVETVRRDGWTEARKTRFLEHLAQRGNVRAACAAVGMSHEAAYQLRRRDPLVARAWAAALDGVEEEVWHRGEVVGTRRRYDSRLLPAHLARLDAAAEAGSAREDGERFDELLALIAGAHPADNVACADDGVPLSRAESVALAMEAAEAFARKDAGVEACEDELLTPAECYEVGLAAAAHWDAWRDEAHATVDRLLAEPAHVRASAVPARTLSGASTSVLARALAGGHPATA